MAPRKKKKINSKSKKCESGDESETDTQFYEVEEIRSCRETDTLTVEYELKWKNYSEKENTFEAEPRILSDKKFLMYASKNLQIKDYIPGIHQNLQSLGTSFQGNFLDILDLYAIIAQTSVFCGSLKFSLWDTIGSKELYLKYIRDFRQTDVLHSLFFPEMEKIESDMQKYSSQMRARLEVFREHPVVQFMLPHVEGNTLYAPPALSNLLFEPVTESILNEKNEHLFPKKSKKKAFNSVNSFINDNYFKSSGDERELPKYKQYRDRSFIGGMDRLDYGTNSRFNVNLALRQEAAKGWMLSVAHLVEPEAPLFMMTGVIRPCTVAHETLKERGEQVAFSTFIEIPGTGMCLDRREFHDFSRYIPHSCKPTCSVRLVESGNAIPDLVVYTTQKLEANGQITIDYFKYYEPLVENHFAKMNKSTERLFKLYQTRVDFVCCLCYSENCREILFVDQSVHKFNKKMIKKDKIANIDPDFKFGGMKIAESDKIWQVDGGKFK